MPIERYDITSYSPDLRPDQPAIVTDCNAIFPTTRGLRPLPSPEELADALTNGWCYGAYEARYLDDTRRRFAGDDEALYELQGASWTDRTGGAQTYGVPTGGRWRFAQFGDITLATNGSDVDPVQAFDTNAAATGFIPLGGLPPHAKYVTTAQNFVFLANLLPASGSGQQVDSASWWTSGIGQVDEWSPGLDTQSANGYLYDTPGGITAAMALGRDIIVYKNRSMYKFEYIGPPVVWATQIISQTAGAWAQESIVDIGGTHVFMGYDDFYIFDGAGAPRSIPSPLREWLFEGWGDTGAYLDKNFAWATWGRWDRELNLVFWHFPSTDITQVSDDQIVLDSYICWNIGSDKWTFGKLNVSAIMNPEIQAEAGLTYGGMGTTYANWNTLNTELWTDPAFSGSTLSRQGMFSSDDNKLYKFTGTPSGTRVQFGDFGAGPDGYTFVNRIRPLFLRDPVDLTNLRCIVYGREKLSDPIPATGEEATLGDTGWFDLRSDARYHRVEFIIDEDIEVVSYDVEYEAGTGIR